MRVVEWLRRKQTLPANAPNCRQVVLELCGYTHAGSASRVRLPPQGLREVIQDLNVQLAQARKELQSATQRQHEQVRMAVHHGVPWALPPNLGVLYSRRSCAPRTSSA